MGITQTISQLIQKVAKLRAQYAMVSLVEATCAEQAMTPYQTNVIRAICWAESQMCQFAVHPNYNKDGTISSTDYGLNQINDFYHIGPGKDFPSTDYVLQNPKADIEWMCRLIKQNQSNFNLWCTFTNKSYMAYLK